MACQFRASRKEYGSLLPVMLRFHSIEEKEICEVVIKPSPRPIFIYDEGGKQQEYYVRVGNSSKPYTLDEFYEYSRRRFK
jgi:hypothetical protein